MAEGGVGVAGAGAPPKPFVCLCDWLALAGFGASPLRVVVGCGGLPHAICIGWMGLMGLIGDGVGDRRWRS
jgi:hypothetical protein